MSRTAPRRSAADEHTSSDTKNDFGHGLLAACSSAQFSFGSRNTLREPIAATALRPRIRGRLIRRQTLTRCPLAKCLDLVACGQSRGDYVRAAFDASSGCSPGRQVTGWLPVPPPEVSKPTPANRRSVLEITDRNRNRPGVIRTHDQGIERPIPLSDHAVFFPAVAAIWSESNHGFR